jgi:hypothetical protein
VAINTQKILGHKNAPIVALIVAVLGLVVVPVLTVPAMVVAGIVWKAAVTWIRVTLVVGGVAFAYFALQHH